MLASFVSEAFAQVARAHEVGYCPDIPITCAACETEIQPGQLRFTRFIKNSHDQWEFHFLCLLEKDRNSKNGVKLTGLEQTWRCVYTARPQACIGYLSWKEEDKTLFKKSLHGIDAQIVLRTSSKEADAICRVSEQSQEIPQNQERSAYTGDETFKELSRRSEESSSRMLHKWANSLIEVALYALDQEDVHTVTQQAAEAGTTSPQSSDSCSRPLVLPNNPIPEKQCTSTSLQLN